MHYELDVPSEIGQRLSIKMIFFAYKWDSLPEKQVHKKRVVPKERFFLRIKSHFVAEEWCFGAKKLLNF